VYRGFRFKKSEAMLTTKKVIEDAIKERETELKNLEHFDASSIGEYEFIRVDIQNMESQIAELKQSLQIIYDANNN
jgi:uncharacterized protein YPO0396